MIVDAESATGLREDSSAKERAVSAFLRFIERKLNVSIVRTVGDGTSLSEPLYLAQILSKHGIIREFGRASAPPDEPQLKAWYAVCNDAEGHYTGGTSWESDAGALYAALAEALERFIWFTQTDYFIRATTGTTAQIRAKGACITPETFVGYADEQRHGQAGRTFRDDAVYTWIQATSLVGGNQIYVPAQVASGERLFRKGEPSIRQSTTNGLATWSTKRGAQLRGALELLERDAYMITWMNRLTAPRIAIDSLCKRDPSLQKIVEYCIRYRLTPHVVQLVTDAPTHALAVVLEDESGHAPRFSIGLRADKTPTEAVKKAITEALRARKSYRQWKQSGHSWDSTQPIEKIGHRERVHYWGDAQNAAGLEFFIAGSEIECTEQLWENESDDAYLSRIVEWCRTKKYNCLSVPLSSSAMNPTKLHIEMVVIPQLQPAYLTEGTRTFGGDRWKNVPTALGYTHRERPFTDAPHPFS